MPRLITGHIPGNLRLHRNNLAAMRVAVLGGGPAGLVTLKHLITAHWFFHIEPIEARLFEAEDQVGGTFRYRTYEDAEVKQPR